MQRMSRTLTDVADHEVGYHKPASNDSSYLYSLATAINHNKFIQCHMW